jgi:hypothetical protein
MLKSENLSGLASYPTARTNLGLGTTSTPTFKNLVISTGSIATSAPVTISQTWSTTGTYTAAKIDVTETATAAAASLLFDLQIGGARRLSVRKNGLTYIAGTLVTPNGLSITSSEDGGNQTASFTTDGVRIPSQSVIGFTSASSGFGTLDTILLRDGAANTLALRNGAAAQTFNVYGTYSTSPSLAYSRLAIACDTSGNATLTTQSTGTAGTVSINGVPVGLGKGSISSNVAVGTGPLIANTTGSHNSILGFQALQTNTSGGYNVAMGYQALYLNTTGVVNSALGAGALSSNTSGQYNLASGVNSLQSNTTGTYNSALGPQALQTNTTGSYNTAAGYNAGTYIANGTSANQTSSNSLFLGTNSKALGVGQDNQIVIGYDATGLGSNTAVLGNSSITTTALRGNVGIGTTAPSSKLHVAETWNASGTTFAAAKIVVTDTASMAASTLLELWSDAVTPTLKYSFGKSGNFQVLGGNSAVINCAQLVTNTGVAGNTDWGVYLTNSSGIILKNTLSLGWSSGVATLGADTVLRRDDEADHLAMRRTTNGQKFSVYGTYPGAAWERFTITAPTSGNVLLGTYKGTGGIARGLEFQTDGVTRLTIAAGGAMTAGGALTCSQVTVGAGAYLFHGGLAAIGCSGSGRHILFDAGGTFYDRLQIGGTSASFPAIKRVGTDLQIVLASTTAAAGVAAGDADLTFIEDRYRRKGAGSPEGVVTAPIGAVYHRTDGGLMSSFYVKESGTGNTGWVGK